jgi:hypothetical protein
VTEPATDKLPKSGYPEWDEEGLSRLPNKAEVAGILFTRHLPKAVLALGLLVLGLAIAIGVPSFSVARSPAYAEARRFMSAQPVVRHDLLSENVVCETVPTRYTVSSDAARFTFLIFGDGAVGTADLWLARGPDTVWHVTSGSFVRATRGRSFVRVLARGDAAAVGSR